MCKLIKSKEFVLKVLFDVFKKALIFLFYYDAEFKRTLLRANISCFIIRVLKTDLIVSVVLNKSGLFVDDLKDKCDLEMIFKDLCTAFKAFSGLISLEEAFAQKGVILKGSIAKTLTITRAIKRLQSLVFPDFWIKRVLRNFKGTSMPEKLIFYKFYYYYIRNLGR